jgi:hypothetical protein
MDNLIDKFFYWCFKQYVKNQITQGPKHDINLVNIYCDIRECVEAEFTEDGYYTLDQFCGECFIKSQKAIDYEEK